MGPEGREEECENDGNLGIVVEKEREKRIGIAHPQRCRHRVEIEKKLGGAGS